MANLNESSSNGTELSEKDPLLRESSQGMQSNEAAEFRSCAERSHDRRSRSPDLRNRDLGSSREGMLQEQYESDEGSIRNPPNCPDYNRNEDDKQLNDDETVKLKGKEYKIKRHCFRDCTTKIFRNRKKCAIAPFVLALVFMAIFIVCILRITEMYWYYQFGDGDSNTKDLFIPVGSVVDVNLTSLDISTIHDNKLNVTVFNKSSFARIAIDHDGDRIPLSLNINISLEKGRCKSILRYWKSRDNAVGTIKRLNDEHDITIRYKWGNITHPPNENYTDHSTELSSTSNIFNISKCFLENDRGNDKNIIHMHICHNERKEVGVETIQTAIIGIDITEWYVLPNKTSYKSIYNDDTDNQNSAVLQFPSLLSELRNSSKLYINTFYLNTDGEDDNKMNLNEIIKLELQPLSSENAMEIIETVVLVITAILSLLLSLMMFGIGIRCCCCHIKTGFCALALFYEEQ